MRVSRGSVCCSSVFVVSGRLVGASRCSGRERTATPCRLVASRDGPNARAPSFGAAGLHPSPESTSSVLLLPGRCDGERRTRTRGRPDDRFRPAEGDVVRALDNLP